MRGRICPSCHHIHTDNGPRDRACQQREDARRHAKERAQGRTTAAWRRLRQAALQRDGYRCRRCGRQTGLTAHLDRRLAGDHTRATLDDITTLCRSCHGSTDAPRSRTAA
jgi:5-methylcytosine-specific restriction endonuclease McrA